MFFPGPRYCSKYSDAVVSNEEQGSIQGDTLLGVCQTSGEGYQVQHLEFS